MLILHCKMNSPRIHEFAQPRQQTVALQKRFGTRQHLASKTLWNKQVETSLDT